jgi:transcriptional regulator with XRE-family HTH domain
MIDAENATPHEAIRGWINQILEIKGWNPNRLAKEAGVSPSTISRALNDERFVLTTKTIEKIKKTVNEHADDKFRNRLMSVIGFEILKEPELEEIEKSQATKLITSFSDHQMIRLYAYRGIDLALCGILPGDMIFVDQSEFGSLCKRTDIALATIRSADGARQNNILRYFDPPYLLTKNLFAQVDSKPLPVDGDTVSIIGRVVGVLRNFPK